MMHVQIVTFGLKGLSDEDYRAHCGAMAPAFSQLPGLISKTWLANAETNTYGGVYLWRDRRSMEAYEASDIFRGMARNPHFEGVGSHSFSVLETATAITSNLNTPYRREDRQSLVHAPGGALVPGR
jgi:heme-degrading monooxygenase HmoA